MLLVPLDMVLMGLPEIRGINGECGREREIALGYACIVSTIFLLRTATTLIHLSLSWPYVQLRLTGAFAVWGLCFASFDCSIAAVRKKVRLI